LDFSDANHKIHSPFKFNSTWLSEADFHNLVRENWTHYSPDNRAPPAEVIANNLARLKLKTISWARKKQQMDEAELKKVEGVLKKLENTGLSSYSTIESKDQLIKLESEKIRLPRQKEETWRLKSREIWLKAGDENSKFFQQYARGRKSINTIWELRDNSGRETSSFNQLADMGMHHFSHIYKVPQGSHLLEILRITEVLPRFVEIEEMESLTKPVLLGELESTLEFFNKDKSPSPDGWPMEFYSTFIELIDFDLLLANEECRITCRMYAGFNLTFLALIPKVDKPLAFDDFRPISLCNYVTKLYPNHCSSCEANLIQDDFQRTVFFPQPPSGP